MAVRQVNNNDFIEALNALAGVSPDAGFASSSRGLERGQHSPSRPGRGSGAPSALPGWNPAEVLQQLGVAPGQTGPRMQNLPAQPAPDTRSGHDSWRQGAMDGTLQRREVDSWRGTPPGGGMAMQQWDPSTIMALIGGGGGPDPREAAIRQATAGQLGALEQALAGITDAFGGARSGLEDAYGNQISALEQGLAEMIGNINAQRDTATTNIGEGYEHARDMALGGIPEVQAAGAAAGVNMDAIYDALAAQLGGMPAQQAQAATLAGGGAGAGAVADRAAVAAAPFAAAGESSRARAQEGVGRTQHAGENYLQQLAAAAPAEAARMQGAVESRAANAVTNETRATNSRIGDMRIGTAGQLGSLDIAAAQQAAEMEMRRAEMVGAQERALAEVAADVSGGTFDRLMQLAQLDASVTNPQMRQMMGLPPMAAPQMDPFDLLRMEQMQLGNTNAQIQNQLLLQELLGFNANPLDDAMALGGNRGFNQALDTLGLTPQQRRQAEQFRRASESSGVDPVTLAQGGRPGMVVQEKGVRGGPGRGGGPASMSAVADQMAQASLMDPNDPMLAEMDPLNFILGGKGALDQDMLLELARILAGGR